MKTNELENQYIIRQLNVSDLVDQVDFLYEIESQQILPNCI